MKSLAVDDPVTVLDETGKLLVHARWDGASAHAYRHGWAGRVNTSVVPRLTDEGVTWCRGHVSAKDPEGKALLVAAALAPEHASKRQDEALVPRVADLLGMKYVFAPARAQE